MTPASVTALYESCARSHKWNNWNNQVCQREISVSQCASSCVFLFVYTMDEISYYRVSFAQRVAFKVPYGIVELRRFKVLQTMFLAFYLDLQLWIFNILFFPLYIRLLLY